MAAGVTGLTGLENGYYYHNKTKKVIAHTIELSAGNLSRLAASILQQQQLIASKTVTAGFDGFVDTVAKIIHHKLANGTPLFFSQIKDFGDYVLQKQGGSFSLEMEQVHVKCGGNMPITANALGKLGARVNCIGALGYPQVNEAFSGFPAGCHLYSFANPGTSAAYEFSDGKMMIADMGSLNHIAWEQIRDTIGATVMQELFKEADIWCLVNWSEIDSSTGIWKGLLKEVIPYCGNKQRAAFFDLSDCSKRGDDAIGEALELLREFAAYASITLSLNRNEASIIHRILYGDEIAGDLRQTGEAIYRWLQPNTLLLHTAREAIAFSAEGSVSAPTFFMEQPAMSTGAGDNFNAGYCAGQLMELDMELSLLLANAVSGYYVRTGTSAGVQDVLQLIDITIGKL